MELFSYPNWHLTITDSEPHWIGYTATNPIPSQIWAAASGWVTFSYWGA